MATQRGSEAFQLADLDVEVTTRGNTTYVGTAKAFSPGERSLSLTRPLPPEEVACAQSDFITEGQELDIRFSLLIRGRMRPFQLRAQAIRSENDDLTVQFVEPDLAALVALQELVTRAEKKASARAATGERVPSHSQDTEAPLSSNPSHRDPQSRPSDNVVSLREPPSNKGPADTEERSSPGAGDATPSGSERAAGQCHLDDTQGDTVVGRNLADLIDELHEEHRELDDRRSREDGPDEAPAPEQLETDTAQRELDQQIKHIVSSDAEELEADLRESAREQASVEEPEELARVDTLSTRSGDALSGITQTLEAELRRCAQEQAATQRRLFEQRMNAAVTQLKQLATGRMRKNAEKIRGACHSTYALKEARLRQRYERLMSLAEKVRRQKAEIHEARTQLEAKLKAVDDLHRQVSRIGETMSRQVDDLEDMVGDDES